MAKFQNRFQQFPSLFLKGMRKKRIEKSAALVTFIVLENNYIAQSSSNIHQHQTDSTRRQDKSKTIRGNELRQREVVRQNKSKRGRLHAYSNDIILIVENGT